MRTATKTTMILSLALAGGLAGCGDNIDPNLVPDAGGGVDAPEVDAPEVDAPPPGPKLCSETFCEDSAILDLSLHGDKVSEGEVTNVEEGGDWVSTIDATAGGYGMSNNNPFLYMKFTEDGLVKVDIDDETALDSPAWDIAARRYIVRLNGGTSGSYCVGAAQMPGVAYADITEEPADVTYEYDAFYGNDDCTTMIEDGSGMPGNPSVALFGWWAYTTCVSTTLQPALIKLDDGRTVKLVLEAYYRTGQEMCNSAGDPGTESAVLTARWQFLPTTQPAR